MDVYSSYQVEIEGGGGGSNSSSSSTTATRVMTCIADSLALAESSVDKLHTLVSGYYNSSKINKKAVPVGLTTKQPSCYSSVKIVILQLCFGTSCVVLQLNHIGKKMPISLIKLFADPMIVFVGNGVRESVSALKTGYGLECNNVIELGYLADRVRRKDQYAGYDLEKLASEIAGLNSQRLGERIPCSSWHCRDLGIKEVEYATIEAYASYLIGDKLLADGRGN